MKPIALAAAALGIAAMGYFTMTGETIVAQDTPTQNKGGGDRVTGEPFASRSVVLGMNGMAATSHPLVSQVALDILKAGGNAVDAAIAANATIGLMEPTGNGIGGDLYAIIWDPKTKQLYGLNASGRAPKGQTLEQLRDAIGRDKTDMPDFGSYSITVPGTVSGWGAMHEKFGSKPFADLMAPAAKYAAEGFPVTQVVSDAMESYRKTYEKYAASGLIEEIDNYKATYLIDGKVPVEGQVFKNPDLAKTLTYIGENGPDGFYKGDIARTMDAYMKRIGGPLRYEDFSTHTAKWVEPKSVNYRGYDVWELPPNGQGIAALQMLQMLEEYDVASMEHNGADFLHLMTEVKKVVYEDRAKFYADDEYFEMDYEYLLSDGYATERNKLISMDKALQSVDHGDAKLISGDTIYMSIADSNGMMVSLIQSNYRGMGSGNVPDGLGFIFQDRGALFNLDPTHANSYLPGKRPFHTIIPAFMTKDGEPLMSFGLMGGGMQPQGHTQIVVNLVDFGMGLQEAGDVARWHHKGSTQPYLPGRMTDGGTLQLESGITPDVLAELQRRGHTVEYAKGPFGGYQAVWRDPKTGVLKGATEMRKDGAAQGY
jgi:gamma-glutamyltranspeptidase/glutathione hydrolase